MAVLVTLACRHYLWPTGRPPQIGDTAYCITCRKNRTVSAVEEKPW